MSEAIGINPRIDCVFKTILGHPDHEDVLLDFLNAIVQPRSPFVGVKTLNPQHDPRMLMGKGSVLDVKAEDADAHVFQVEMQALRVGALESRMVYTISDLFTRQGRRGQDYGALRSAISIWLLDENLFSSARRFHHRFQLYDARQQKLLSSHLQIHTLELERWRRSRSVRVQKAQRGWMEFFASAETWGTLPKHLVSPPLEKAMETLKQFKENDEWFRVYAEQEEYARVQATLQGEQRRNEARRRHAEEARIQAEEAARLALIQQQQAEARRQRAEEELRRAEEERQRAEEELRRVSAEREAAYQVLEQTDGVVQAQQAELERLRALLRERGGLV